MPPVTTTPEEFVGWGGGLTVESSLKISFPDSTRDLLKYLSYEIQDKQLVFQMMDIAHEEGF